LGWCAGASFIPISKNLTWAPNQPDFLKAGENCLHMRIHKNASSTALSDRNCSDKYIYACEVAKYGAFKEKEYLCVVQISGNC
jgi:hypothetical protein